MTQAVDAPMNLGEVSEPMRIWFDTEFIEDGKTIELVSIGLVAEDGREYYAECAEADHDRADEWVKANVIAHLRGGSWEKPRAQIAREIIAFAGPKPEFWAYYADYDWVALCQLFGRMIDLPKDWPMFCRDIKQWCTDLGDPKLPEQSDTEHHALNDARWNREAWDFLARRHSGAKAGDAVGVKPLEWREWAWKDGVEARTMPFCWCGEGLGLKYDVEHWGGTFDLRIGVKKLGLPFDTLDEAKAAAQADYKARILSALSPSPDGGEAVALRKALTDLCDAWEYNGGSHRGNITKSVAAARAVLAVPQDAPARPALPNGELDQGALEAAAKAIHDHWQNAPHGRSWEETCDKLPRAADDFRAKATEGIRAYLKSAPLPQDLSRGERTEAELSEMDETLAALEGRHGEGWINITMAERRLFAKLLRAALSSAGKPDTTGERERATEAAAKVADDMVALLKSGCGGLSNKVMA